MSGIGNRSIPKEVFEEERFKMIPYNELNEDAYYSFWMTFKLYDENNQKHEDRYLCIGSQILNKDCDFLGTPTVEVSFLDDDYFEIAKSTLSFVSNNGEVSDICKGIKSEPNSSELSEASRVDGYFVSDDFDVFDEVLRLSAS